MNKRLEQAKLEHQKYLEKMGVSPQQLREKNVRKRRAKLKPFGVANTYYADDSLAKLAVPGQDIGTRKDVIANIYKEAPHVQAEIKRKAQCTAPLYNKGPIQYIGTAEQAKHIGRK